MQNFHEIVHFNLDILYKKYKGKDVFKARAYKKALDNLSEKIFTVNDVDGIIGGKIREKIRLIIETNSNIEEVTQTLQDPEFEIVNSLMKVHGIGPSKAKELYKKHEITSIEKLRENDHLLNDLQRKGLKYLTYTMKRIPRKEMDGHNEFLEKNINQEFKITGSYIRKESTSGDIDVLISGKQNNLQQIVNLLIDCKYIIKDGIFANGEVKFMGICKLPRCSNFRRIDMLYTPVDEYSFANLYFTGNYKFNTDMRKHALTKGYSLNEQCLTDVSTGKRIDTEFKDEKAIFEFLDYPYVTPENRTY